MAPGPLLAAVASVQLLLAQGLRSRLQPQRAGNRTARFAADFVACDEPAPCGRGNLTWHYLLDLLKGAGPAAKRVQAEGRTPTLMHIGSADLGNIAKFADIDLYNKVHSSLPSDVKEAYKLVLVDPNDVMLTKLRENARRHLPIGMSHVEIIHGMVAGSCERNATRMYRLSEQLEKDFGLPFEVYGTWLSTNSYFAVNTLKAVAKMEKRPWFFTQRQFDSLIRLSNGNMSDYVVEVDAPCYTPASLLERVGAKASDLAMVVIDAEFSDRFIVAKLLELPGFKPGYLQWEGELADGNMRPLGSDLQAHGFRVGDINSSMELHDQTNIVAVPAW